MAPPALPADYTAARDKLLAAKSKLEGLVAASVIDPVAVEAAVAEAASAQKEVETTRAAAQPKVPPKVAAEHTTEEAAIKAIVEDAAAKGDAAAGEKKKRKDEAKKKLMQEVAKASLLTGDVDVLSAVVKEGQDADMSAKDLAEGEAKLHEMQTFHVTLKAAADELRGAAKGIALEIAERAGGLEELEGKIKEHKEGAVALLNRVVVELYLGILTKAAPTAIATDALDASIQEATALGCDETLLKSMKKKKDEATKAQVSGPDAHAHARAPSWWTVRGVGAACAAARACTYPSCVRACTRHAHAPLAQLVGSLAHAFSAHAPSAPAAADGNQGTITFACSPVLWSSPRVSSRVAACCVMPPPPLPMPLLSRVVAAECAKAGGQEGEEASEGPTEAARQAGGAPDGGGAEDGARGSAGQGGGQAARGDGVAHPQGCQEIELALGGCVARSGRARAR